MILALSFLVPDAIVSEPIAVEYIETVERITDSAYAIIGQSAGVNEPRVFRTRTWLYKSMAWVLKRLGKRLPESQLPINGMPHITAEHEPVVLQLRKLPAFL